MAKKIKILDNGHLPNRWTGEPEPALLDSKGKRLPAGAPPVWLEFDVSNPKPWYNSAGQKFDPQYDPQQDEP